MKGKKRRGREKVESLQSLLTLFLVPTSVLFLLEVHAYHPHSYSCTLLPYKVVPLNLLIYSILQSTVLNGEQKSALRVLAFALSYLQLPGLSLPSGSSFLSQRETLHMPDTMRETTCNRISTAHFIDQW
jgi:hypothetical protein